jgi:uncharacterized protein
VKYLVVILVIAIAGWLMLRDRDRARSAARPRRTRKNATPAEMVECLHCGIHLPRCDAIEDDRGAFCNEAHRLAGPR